MQSPNLGKWAPGAIEATVNASTSNRYYAGLDPLTQFAHSVAKLLAVRRARSPSTLNVMPSVYMLGTAPSTAAAFKRQPTFSSGGVEVAGHAWFGPESLSTSRGTQLPGADADENFQFIETTLASGTVPAIYYDGSADPHVMRLYPRGVGCDDVCDVVTISGATLTKEGLKDVLDEAHQRALITPTACGAASRLWQDSVKAFPAKESEKVIQEILENVLALALGAVRVKRELTGVAGRFDLGLSEQDPVDPAVWTNHALLELKIVKTFTNSGGKVPAAANRQAISKGLDQASSYRKEHGFRLSALCCFDMQKKHTLQQSFKHEKDRAKRLQVELWSWPLFPTTAAYRASVGASAPT